MPIKLLDIPPRLLAEKIVPSTAAAHATLVYAIKWMEGVEFDLSKSAVKVHRARLRRIGLDIAKPFSGEIASLQQQRK